ncbi:type VI secretion system contractile sheath domain-containing protein [Spongorhabdus nitratireducens]
MDHWDHFINNLLTELDTLLSQQLGEILRHPLYKNLEARWSALETLARLPVNHQQVQLRILDCSWEELSDDLNNAMRIESSVLYQRIGQEELNTAGGQPFGLLIADYEPCADMLRFAEFPGFSTWDDLYTLQLVATLGAKCLCPVVTSLSEAFIGEGDEKITTSPVRLNRCFNEPEYASWNLLRQQDEARFLGVVWPPVKVRSAFDGVCDGFIYREEDPQEAMIWASGAWAFASVVMREFDRLNWFGYLRSCQAGQFHGGIVNLPGYSDEASGFLVMPQVRYRLSEGLESAWREQGFMPLSTGYMTEYLAFFDNNSVYQAGDSSDEKIGAMLQSTLMGCRFGHYLKVLIRSHIGGFDSVLEAETWLDRWLQNYCSEVDYGEDSIMARYPLRRASVELEEEGSSPGCYQCVIRLQPQFQYDYLASDIVVRTEL